MNASLSAQEQRHKEGYLGLEMGLIDATACHVRWRTGLGAAARRWKARMDPKSSLYIMRKNKFHVLFHCNLLTTSMHEANIRQATEVQGSDHQVGNANRCGGGPGQWRALGVVASQACTLNKGLGPGSKKEHSFTMGRNRIPSDWRKEGSHGSCISGTTPNKIEKGSSDFADLNSSVQASEMICAVFVYVHATVFHALCSE